MYARSVPDLRRIRVGSAPDPCRRAGDNHRNRPVGRHPRRDFSCDSAALVNVIHNRDLKVLQIDLLYPDRISTCGYLSASDFRDRKYSSERRDCCTVSRRKSNAPRRRARSLAAGPRDRHRCSEASIASLRREEWHPRRPPRSASSSRRARTGEQAEQRRNTTATAARPIARRDHEINAVRSMEQCLDLPH